MFKKFHGKDILDVSEFLGGKALKTFIGISFIIILLIVPMLVIKNFSETLQVIYFKTSPTIYIVLFFIICSTIANRYSLKVIAKANLIIVPVVFLSILIILISSIREATPERIFPIMGYGANKTFLSGLSNLFSFSSIAYLLFLNPVISKSSQFKKISIISITLSGIYLFLSVTSILLSLPYTMQSGESFSLYLLTRNLEYGRFVQRMDAIFILIWIISTVSYISIAINLSINIFRKLTNIVDTSSINYSINLFVLSLLLLPISFSALSNFIGKVFEKGKVVILVSLTLIVISQA